MNLDGQLDVIDLTTLARVKDLTPVSVADTTQDTLISRLITDVSARIARLIGFHISSTSRTEVYRLAKHKRVLRLDAKNLTSVTTIKESPTQISTADWLLVSAIDAENYVVNKAGGWIEFLFRRNNDPGFMEVIYVGGFGAAAANIITDFPELATACDIQVKYMMERLNTIGGDITTIAGASTNFGNAYTLQREVMEIIGQHRRGRV